MKENNDVIGKGTKTTQTKQNKDITRFQQLAKNIDKFDPKLDRLVSINTLRTMPKTISYEKIMSLPADDSQWIVLSKIYFNEPQYQRIILYYASMYLYQYYLSPVNISGTVNKKRLEKEYREGLDFLDDSLNVETFSLNAMVSLLTEGAVFYYYDWVMLDGKPNFVLTKLPREYCLIIGTTKNEQLPLVQLDVSFIQIIIDELVSRKVMTQEEILKQYPLAIQKAYLDYRSGKAERYIILNPSHAIGFSTYNGLPPFAQSLRQLARIRKFETVRDDYIETSLQKILFQHVATNKDGDPEVDLVLAAEFHNNLKKITKGISRLNAFTSLAEVEVLDLNDTTTKNDLEFIKEFENKYYNETGTSQELFEADTAGTMEYSSYKDESYVWGLIKQIEVWLNFIINAEIGSREKRLYNFVVSYLPVSYRNREKMMDSYLKNAQYGYSKILPQIAIGVKQRHLESLLYLENDLLNLNERLVPLKSSYTMSGDETGADSTNGRPKSNTNEKKDSTLAKDASQ